MEIVKVDLGPRSYEIFIGQGLLPSLGEKIKSAGLTGRAGIVTNDTVGPIYAKGVIDSIRNAGYETSFLSLPDGEKFKSIDSATRIYDWLLRSGSTENRFWLRLAEG